MTTRIVCRSTEGDLDSVFAQVADRFDERRSLRMLGLTPSPDPVMIITAAQVRLRRWRRATGVRAATPHGASNRIQRITEARDTLLRRATGFSTTGFGTNGFAAMEFEPLRR